MLVFAIDFWNSENESPPRPITSPLAILKRTSFLQIKGDIPFKEEVQRQIALILLENDELAVKVETEITRPTTQLQELKKQADEKSNNKDVQANSELSDLKQNLDAKIVLKYAKAKYKLDSNNYVITENNKIILILIIIKNQKILLTFYKKS